MSYSLNEIEALSKRAARGAGLSWGMAEEAGKAVRWLASHDLPGVALLADLLTQNDAIAPAAVAPISLDGVWQSRAGTLCPLASGAALTDCSERLERHRTVEMANVSHPLLIVPFAASAAQYIKAPVSVSWPGVRMCTDGDRLWRDDPHNRSGAPAPVDLVSARVEQSDGVLSLPKLRGSVCPVGWARLGAFAHRTYAPATEQSRILGAGAGVSDND